MLMSVAARYQEPERLLVIRFSSFGDIVQAVSVPGAFRRRFPGARVDWLVREDFQSLLVANPDIDRVIAFSRHANLFSLVKLAWSLSGQHYSHVYDAHSNLRSLIVRLVFGVRSATQMIRALPHPQLALRSKERLKRWLFFRWRLKVLPQPYRGAESFLKPLKKWGIESQVPEAPQFRVGPQVLQEIPASVKAELQTLRALGGPVIAAAPSAAWEMKRWPIEHWVRLMEILPDTSFVFLGGPEDKFIDTIRASAGARAVNLAGRLSLEQSCEILNLCDLVIANDTGLLHVADQMERPTVALIGPTAFGYPSHHSSRTAEIQLWCKPCSKDGRGGCKNDLYKRCLVELSPEQVAAATRALLADSPKKLQSDSV